MEEKSRFGAKKYSKCMKTWHEASTSGYCLQELKRNGKVVYQGVACSKTKYALNSAQCSKTNQPANISYKLNSHAFFMLCTYKVLVHRLSELLKLN